MIPQTCWRLNGKLSFQDLSASLPKNYILHVAETAPKNVILLDDFDWSIFHSGWLLIREGKDKIQLSEANDNQLSASLTNTENRFWWQLPTGELADKLKELVPIRAFVEKYSCQLKTDHLTILNADDKIVVRIELYTIIGTGNQGYYFIKSLPLRGYHKEFLQIKKSLESFTSAELPDTNLRSLLLQTDLKINPPGKKITFQLRGIEPAEVAVSKMAVKMIQLARHQEQGIIDDIDTEFIHQYRVNIRKTRSLISLFKKSFSAQRYLFYKTELKALGGQSNNLRDLDVFLLDQNYYLSMLPEELWPGLVQIFNKIEKRRTIALRGVVNSLTSETYLEQISRLLLTLQQAPELVTKQSRLEIKALARKKILAQYQQIYTDGLSITDKTPDQLIHDLRIECKKLRYLLEFFAELFPAKQIKKLIKLLKVLQDNLGRFNDFSVQRNFLLQLAQKKISAEELASIHGLAAVLFNKQNHERNLVTANIAIFLDKPVDTQFRRLLNTDFKRDYKV